MAATYGNYVPQDGLALYIDVNNPRCLENPTNPVGSGTRLYNLSYSSNSVINCPYLTPSGNATGWAQMSFPTENGKRVAYQNAYAAGAGNDPGWLGNMVDSTRVAEYTFSSWFRYQVGSTFQIAENIYGGGFNSQTSFYISPSGTSLSTGVLHYSPGNTNNFSNNYTTNGTSEPGGSDDAWHMHTHTTTYSGPNTFTSRFYIDGVEKSAVINASNYTPWASGQITWGSWAGTYGNYSGFMNLFMYYERTLSPSEVKLLYQNQRSMMGV